MVVGPEIFVQIISYNLFYFGCILIGFPMLHIWSCTWSLIFEIIKYSLRSFSQQFLSRVAIYLFSQIVGFSHGFYFFFMLLSVLYSSNNRACSWQCVRVRKQGEMLIFTVRVLCYFVHSFWYGSVTPPGYTKVVVRLICDVLFLVEDCWWSI